MGESFGCWEIGADATVMPYIDQANIACGFHAGDPDVMVSTIKLAKEQQVQIGAHPGYDDKKGFGRRSIEHSSEQITYLVTYQVGALKALCELHNVTLDYIKPHGALYNDMMSNITVFKAIVDALSAFEKPLALMILARPDLQNYKTIAQQAGIKLIYEVFADRAYDAQGYLLSRNIAGSVLKEQAQIIEQVQGLVDKQTIKTVDGKEIKLQADSICVHGDNAQSIAVIKQLRQLLG